MKVNDWLKNSLVNKTQKRAKELEMEDTDEFKWAVKVVIKRQMRDLLDQLRASGEEIAVMSVNLQDGTCSHFGSPSGEWFISEQKNLTGNFLNFCQSKSNKSGNKLTLSGKKNRRRDVSGDEQKTPSSRKTASNVDVQEINTDSGPAVLKIKVPKYLAGGVSEEELAGLVGRLVATQLKTTHSDGGGATFDSLVDVVKGQRTEQVGDKRPASSPLKTPVSKKSKQSAGETEMTRSTRSGRRVSSRFMDGINSLKKSSKKDRVESVEEEEETKSEPLGDTTVIEQIADLQEDTMKRVDVSIAGQQVDVASTSLLNPSLEALAAPIIEELDNSRSQVTNKNKATVLVSLEDEGEAVSLELVPKPSDAAEDSEESDLDESAMIQDEEGSDPDFDPAEMDSPLVKPVIPKVAKQVKGVGKYERDLSGLVRRKQKKPLTETMPIPCGQCGVTLTGKSNLKSHIRRVHMGVKNHVCVICSKGFWSNTARESHMLSVHTRRCEACQEYVVESVPWGKGINMKTRRDVICSCGAVVSIFSLFGRRRIYLRDDEPDEDGNTVMSKRQKSTAGTKYACGTCGKLYLKKSNCERHARAHTEIKDIVCDICGNGYTYEASLQKHLAQEHGIVKHACELCGKNYSNPVSLKVHMSKAHQKTALGENVAVFVQEKSTPHKDIDLEEEMDQMAEEEEDEGEIGYEEIKQEDGEGMEVSAVASSHVLTQIPTSGQIVVSSSGNEQILVTATQAGEDAAAGTTVSEIVTSAEEAGIQSTQIVMTSDGEIDNRQLIQHVMQHEGPVVTPEGVAIIIKQVAVQSQPE